MATKLAMTVTVKAMDSQRWLCRIQLFQFNAISSEDAEAQRGRLQPVRAKTSSSLAKNCCHPALAPP
jgi:hypothetical protein